MYAKNPWILQFRFISTKMCDSNLPKGQLFLFPHSYQQTGSLFWGQFILF